MNLPNKITLSRILLIPIFVLFLTPTSSRDNANNLLLGFNNFKANYGDIIGCAIFLLASCTDGVDGYIARKYNLVTNLGIFLDPIADKLLITSALILLVEKNIISSWVTIVIISREFIITGFRLIASDNNLVISANNWGKLKTISQIIFIAVALVSNRAVPTWYQSVFNITLVITVTITVYSGVVYIKDNISLLKEK